VLVGLARQTADGVIVECRLGAARSAR